MNLTPESVLERELALIRKRRTGALGASGAETEDGAPRAADVLTDAHATSTFGVAFSGGGIRSATFNLGVLQGLSEKGLLKWVDILSTVSGGGYIGSWLHGLIRNHDAGQPAGTEARLKKSITSPPGTPGDDPIMFLRAYSNYLAPRPGLFSSDSWTIGVIWFRNFLLNQLILAPALAALIAAGLAATFLNQVARSASTLAAGAAGVALAVATILLVRNLYPIAKRSTESEAETGTAAQDAHGTGLEGSRQGLWIVALVFMAAIALGTSQLDIDATLLRIVVLSGTILLMLLVQVGGGFIGCSVARRKSHAQALFHVVWMALVAGAVATVMLLGAWQLTGSWNDSPWNILIFGPALMTGAVLGSIMLLVGLMGADYPDAAREWTARIGSHLAIAAMAWMTLLALALLGPWGVSRLLVEFRTIGIGAIVTWAITAITGAMAGNSAKTDGAAGGGTKRILEILTSVAPTVFLVGYVVLLATGVHMVLDRFVPPATRAAAVPASTRYDVSVDTPAGAGVEVRVEGIENGWLADVLLPVDEFERGYPSRLMDTDGGRLQTGVIWLAVFAVIAFVASVRININEFSLHHFYKNRLVRCYLGASNKRRRANSLTGFDPRDDFPLSFLTPNDRTPAGGAKPAYFGPYPIVNTALNLNTGSELAQQERKAASFIFTPDVCGFDPSTRERVAEGAGGDPSPLGYRPTWGYAYPHGPNLGTTVAISGAAANPNSGYHTSGPVAFLLTVFNARLGWWLGNPRWRTPSAQDGPTLALKYLFAELLGQTTKRTKFINLSDGGHFENLGLYELVRRRTRFIIVCDAEEDGGLTFGSLGGVIRKCRADFGVEIDIDPRPIRREDGLSGAHCVVGTITYPEDEPAFAAGLTGRLMGLDGNVRPRARGWLLYLKSSLTGDEPADVVEYQAQHAEFPHESTGDQFFSESQFESYRRLGLHVLRSAFDGVKVEPGFVDPEEDGVDRDLARRYPLTGIFQALARRWYAPIPVSVEAATRLANAYVETMRRLAASPELAPLYRELVSRTPPPVSEATPAMLAFGMDLLQLMQNVFTEFKLESAFNQANPRNGGWIQVFNKWVQSDLLYAQIWPMLRHDYHAIFRQFVDDLHRHGVPDVPGRL
jgi:hypothetical protein